MADLSRKCPNCRERRVAEIRERYDVTVEHDGRHYEISIPDLTLLKCEACGNRVLPDAADDLVSDAIRDAAGLLSPLEMTSKRLGLNLSQKDLADLINIPEPIYARWESGGLIQQRHSDLLLRSLFAVPELRRYLYSRRIAVEQAHPQVA